MARAKNSHPVPIVGIGASAGGVEALGSFFRGVDAKPGLGFVIVTHLSPDRESMMHEIVARYTKMKVYVAADGALVEANTVHVLPPDAVISIAEGRLQLHKLGPSRRERRPIDVFFSALAKDRGEYCAGVILSGGDSDGTLGVKAIKERGGLTLAQVADGSGPAHPSMPDTAISSGMIDFAVPAEEMGKRLSDFVRGLNMLDDMAGEEKDAEGDRSWADARQEIYTILRSQVGHDFRGYKANTFLRRVQRRMQANQIAAPDAYVALLRQSPVEASALFRDLLINVTNFFRDAAAFETLASSVIPSLFEGRGAEDTIRIWSPGCATGEEVYSIGILMAEHMSTLSNPPRVQIFATDIDARALSVARAARYPEALLESVSEERRRRFFVVDSGTYQVCKEVRDLCVFSPHSVIRDPPFSRMDLVSCRNLLIYFGAEIQKSVIPTFHYSLRAGGYLFLGMSENVSQYAELFTPVDKKHRIFRRRDDVVSRVRLPSSIPGFAHSGARAPEMARPQPNAAAVRQAIEAQVLDNFSPAHVVVNEEGEVFHYSRRTGKYLEAPEGAPSRHLLSLARKGLRLELRTVLREAVETGLRTVRRGVGLETEDGRVQLITVTVEPVERRGENQRAGEALFLVLFADDGPAMSADEAQVRSTAHADDAAVHLEGELRESRERLQAMIEEYETSIEELKSSNEELVSVNEEVQSANEELEAGKEEVQSLNEEMQTVNAELTSKVDEVNEAHNDLRNLFDSTQIATVFLDSDLTIRTFTPAATEIFNIRASDHGRPITDLSTRIPLPALTEDIRHVFWSGETVERAVSADDEGPSYLLRIMPYRSEADIIGGVLLTFVDVTLLTLAESREKVLQRSEARQKTLIAELNQAIRAREEVLAVVSHDLGDPLAAITLMTALLQRSDLAKGDKVKEYVNSIATSADQMRRLIRDLLDFSKMQSGTFSVRKKAENAADVLTTAAASIRSLAEGRRQTLTMDIPATLPQIMCDRHRVVQALSNLMGNAIKFTPEGAAISVQANLQGDDLVISVSDTGPGISPDDLPKVFDRFWQLDPPRSTGAGLGLTIAKGIADAHGGKIWAESQVGVGSTFHFAVPLGGTVKRGDTPVVRA